MPGASDAASTWLARHLGHSQPGDSGDGDGDGDTSLTGASAGHPDTSPTGGTNQPGEGSQPGGPCQPSSNDTDPADPYPDHPGAGQPGEGSQARGGPSSARPDIDELIGPDPRDPFGRPRPRAARRAAARAGQPGWLTGKAAAAYTCDAKIAPMVCGHLDRNLLARAVTDLLTGDLANLITSTDPVPAAGPRCACDEHPPAPRATIPGALPGLPASPATGRTRHRRPAAWPASRTPCSAMPSACCPARPGSRLICGPSSPAGSSPPPASRWTSARPPSKSRPTCAAPSRSATGTAPSPAAPPPRPLPRPPRHPPITGRTDQARQPHPAVHVPPPHRRAPLGLDAATPGRRHHHGGQPRRPQNPAQPQPPTRPGPPLGRPASTRPARHRGLVLQP